MAIEDEGDTVVAIDVSSLEALADQLHTLTGLPDRHKELSERKGEHVTHPRLQWAAAARTRDNDAATHAYEVIKALDRFCVRLRDAARKVGKDFAETDQFTAKELQQLAEHLASTRPDVR